MGFCLNGLKSGPICLGDTMAQLHGDGVGAEHAGLVIMGIVFVAALVFVFRNPA